MVNHVVPRPELSSFVMALAQKIAAKPSFALKLTKEAVNRSVDVMGQPAAIDQAFALHGLTFLTQPTSLVMMSIVVIILVFNLRKTYGPKAARAGGVTPHAVPPGGSA